MLIVYTVYFLSLDLDGFIKHMLWEEVHEKSSLMQLSDRLLDSTSMCQIFPCGTGGEEAL